MELRSPEVQADLTVRLKRIEGQVRGVQKMVEEGARLLGYPPTDDGDPFGDAPGKSGSRAGLCLSVLDGADPRRYGRDAGSTHGDAAEAGVRGMR